MRTQLIPAAGLACADGDLHEVGDPQHLQRSFHGFAAAAGDDGDTSFTGMRSQMRDRARR